jgi:uncharacterized delta-60 repeat protein
MHTALVRVIVFAFVMIAGLARAQGVPLVDPVWGGAGSNGTAYVGFDIGGSFVDFARRALLLPDGRLVMAGFAEIAPSATGESRRDIAITRSQAGTGVPDLGFGGGTGRVTMNLPSSLPSVDIDRFADGKLIFIATQSNSTALVGRLYEDGSVDPGFGLNGRRNLLATNFLDAATELFFPHVVALADGKSLVVATAYREIPSVRYCIGVMRLNANGSTDMSFGAGTGRVCLAPDSKTVTAAAANAVRVLDDGRLLLAGLAYHSGGAELDMAALVLSAEGAPDANFGTNGWAFVGFDLGGTLDDEANALVVDAGGRILLAGETDTATGRVVAVARLLPAGELDTSFAQQGKLVLDFSSLLPGSIPHPQSLLVTPERRILVGGYVGSNTFVVSLLNNGVLDPGFGLGGLYLHAQNYGWLSEQLLHRGDYLYLIGYGSRAPATSVDFAASRRILPLFRSGFD